MNNFSYYVYFFSPHVSGDYVPIVRRNSCIYATLGLCQSVWMTVWYAVYVSGDYLPIISRNNCIYATLGVCHPVWMTVWYAVCIPDSHPHRVTNTKCRIDTVIYSDDGHIVARNM